MCDICNMMVKGMQQTDRMKHNYKHFYFVKSRYDIVLILLAKLGEKIALEFTFLLDEVSYEDYPFLWLFAR